MEEMVEVRKEVSDMPCGNAIPAEDAGHQTEKDVAGRESDRVRYILYLRGFERTLLDRAQENGCNALWAEGE